MFLYNYELHGSVRYNRLTKSAEVRGTPGWSPSRVEEVMDPLVFHVRFAEPLQPGYELRVSALAEGRLGVVGSLVTEVSGKGFTVSLTGAEGDLPEILGFCFEAAGQTVVDVPDDRRLDKSQALEDIHAVETVLNHEAEFGFVCVMASASIEALETTQLAITEQEKLVKSASDALAEALDVDREWLALALKKARIKLERLQKLEAAAKYWDSALEFGRLWGKYSAEEQSASLNGRYVPICTGGGPGIMRAAAIGAREMGAQVIGIDSVFKNDENYKFNDPLQPISGLNPRASHHSIASNVRLICNDFSIRESTLINYAYVVLFWPGGFGTSWEVFETLSKIQTSHLRRWRTKAIFVHREFWQPLFDTVAHFRNVGTVNAYGDRFFIPGVDDDPQDYANGAFVAEVVDTPQEAFSRTRDYVELLSRENKLSRK
jgi:predicted Rossmann-fold nucleotide-binding protein